MKDKIKIIGIIPVKSNSKRFPDKNFSKFNRITLIENTINKLIKVGIDLIVISTDDIEKLHSSIKYNISNPNLIIINRPEELAQDDSKSEDVILSVIHNLYSDGKTKISEDYIIVLAQVTSPNWSPHHLSYALHKLESKKVDSVISVSPDYKPNGCFYIIKKDTFILYKKLYLPNMYLVKLNWNESIDIDFEYQLQIAQSISKDNYDK